MNEFKNLNSNKNTDEIINKIQNSLNRLQSAINNKQIADNLNKKNETNTKNIADQHDTAFFIFFL